MFPIDLSILSLAEMPLLENFRQQLATSGVEEIGFHFIIPDIRRHFHWKGRKREVHLRYPVRVLDKDGRGLYLRSYGTDFNILPIEWLNTGLNAVYSIGLAVDVHAETYMVMLLQSFTTNLSINFIDSIEALVTEYVVSEKPEYDLPCIRIAAILRCRLSRMILQESKGWNVS